MKVPSWPFYLFVTGLAILIISPVILAHGMFMDGLMYAAISNNLALGIGDFWYLHFSKTLYPAFHEHPPLAFGLQSILFRIFGESRWVERTYSLFTFMMTGIIMIKIWINVTGKQQPATGWIPLLLWITVPLVSWAMCNNMLESTMMVFTSLSILFLLLGYSTKSRLFLVPAGLFVSLAFLTKGFTGLFVLSFPFWVYIMGLGNDIKRFVADTLLLLMISVLPIVFLYLIYPEAYQSLEKYFNQQVLRSIETIQTVDSRFYILKHCLRELLPMLITGMVVLIFTRRPGVENRNLRWAAAFFFLSLSGVAPIMISLKQSGFYILATFPFFALATALAIQPQAESLLNRIRPDHPAFNVFKAGSVIIFFLGLISSFYFRNSFSRDETKLRDIYSICTIAPDHSVISIEPGLQDDWSLHAYFQRHAHISLDFSLKPENQWLLVRKNSDFEVPQSYLSANIDLRMFELYRKNETSD